MIHSLSPILCCPDDGGALEVLPEKLRCEHCGREYPLVDGNLVSLVSSEPASLAEDSPYAAGYLAARADVPAIEDPKGEPVWSIPEQSGRRLFQYKRRQIELVGGLIGEGCVNRGILCDFSAGPGYYTVEYAKTWRYVIHCDLCAGSLAHARRRAKTAGVNNILFVRMDYLRPPFRQSLERIICLDTLIRGERHEQALAAAIHRSLSPGGAAVVDFHNWWHNPFRRLGLLPENFAHNRSYDAREIGPLLASAGIPHHERIPFHQEIDPASTLSALIARILPPTRWIYRFDHATQ